MSEKSPPDVPATPASGTGRPRPGGRSSQVRAAVLQAALAIITEGVAGDVSLSHIARRAGVQTSTIMRRWGSVHAVLLDAVLTYSEQRIPLPDNGSLRSDLIAMAQSISDYLAGPQGGTLAKMMAAAEDNPSTARTRELFWASRYEAAAVVVRRAVDRGEVSADVDATLLLELLIGPIHFRHLLTREVTDPDLIERSVDAIVRCFGSPPSHHDVPGVDRNGDTGDEPRPRTD